MAVSSTERRRPGRPPQTDEEQARARENIVRATRAVFAEQGYHGISVARILEQAGIARPTFYRYFRNADEPLLIAIDVIGKSLMTHVVSGVEAAEGDIPKVIAAIDGYLAWSQENRDALRSLYVAMHDPSSPVSSLRGLTVNSMVDLLTREFAAAGRPMPDRWMFDVYVNQVEYTGYRLYSETDGDEESLRAARSALLRTAVAVFGTREDWRLAESIPMIMLPE
jgi:AcrR family transcriptional regulator